MSRPLPNNDDERDAKRPRSPGEASLTYTITARGLATLGGPWVGVPPFSGNEEQFYRWVSEPALWARVVLTGLEGRTQYRLSQHHAAMHDALDASGFVLWRSFPGKRPLTVALKQAGMPRQTHTLPCVTTRQAKLPPSSRFCSEWESHTFVAEGGGAPPGWVYSVRKLVQQATFRFMGAEMPVVDQGWARERFQRSDAITYGLMRAGAPGKRPQVVAGAISTRFPAERLLRSLVLAGKDDQILYIDVVCAAERGAAYRLLCDIVEQAQRENPERRLYVVLMAVISSDVLACYRRWGFSYGGVVERGNQGLVEVIDRLPALTDELRRFEEAQVAGWPLPKAGDMDAFTQVSARGRSPEDVPGGRESL
mmetsp:Transcript_58818/g.161426  ORF Transcript_58818/g.161426 Transcript_58818/m.161426 type:complete len:366 (+) Transcript_58818:110-1207(+)